MTGTKPKRVRTARSKTDKGPLIGPLSAAIANELQRLDDAVLLRYQSDWIADRSQLKVAEKSRRIGLTWAEASDNVLTAASQPVAGGMNVYYIGYNMDMAIEYIEACAMWARVFNEAAEEIEEGVEVFKDGNDEKAIKTYTIRFASGFRIVALSSRPANLRGKQGVVVIDEAAFHQDLGELLKAAMALTIWGGQVRIISTHNGDQNPFNELVNEIRAGKRAGSVHRISFDDAIAAGLYRRVAQRQGKGWTIEGQDQWRQSTYSFYGDAAAEELDVIPSQGSGAWLSTSLIESRMEDRPVFRLTCPVGFEQHSDHDRWREVQEWLEFYVGPATESLDPALLSYFAQDFGRSSDLTVMAPCQVDQKLVRQVPFLVELRNVPHKQQTQIAEFILDRMPGLVKGAVDGRGNGHAVAESLAQKYGYNRIEIVMLTESWYREQMPGLKIAFEDDTIRIPRDKDTLGDLRSVKMIRGVARVPDTKGTSQDGGKRHGDSAIALALMHYATRQDIEIIDFHRVPLHGGRDSKLGAGWRQRGH